MRSPGRVRLRDMTLTRLSQLAMPVGLFQGELDHNTPAAGVRALEQRAKAAGKTNLEFRYFMKRYR